MSTEHLKLGEADLGEIRTYLHQARRDLEAEDCRYHDAKSARSAISAALDVLDGRRGTVYRANEVDVCFFCHQTRPACHLYRSTYMDHAGKRAWVYRCRLGCQSGVATR